MTGLINHDDPSSDLATLHLVRTKIDFSLFVSNRTANSQWFLKTVIFHQFSLYSQLESWFGKQKWEALKRNLNSVFTYVKAPKIHLVSNALLKKLKNFEKIVRYFFWFELLFKKMTTKAKNSKASRISKLFVLVISKFLRGIFSINWVRAYETDSG